MATVIEGQTDQLKVVAMNALGRAILPLPDAKVANTVPANLLSAVDLATGNFTFTADGVAGDDSLTATVSTVVSLAYIETVVADNTVASVTIQPQVASVTIKPQ